MHILCTVIKIVLGILIVMVMVQRKMHQVIAVYKDTITMLRFILY